MLLKIKSKMIKLAVCAVGSVMIAMVVGTGDPSDSNRTK